MCGNTLNDLRIPHRGDVIGRVIDGAFEVLNNFEKANHRRDQMKSVHLTVHEQIQFAHDALSLKYQDESHVPITKTQLLRPRRHDDQKSDLWTAFNRIQENLMKGSLFGRDKNGRYMRTRAVVSIDQTIKLNRALWTLADNILMSR